MPDVKPPASEPEYTVVQRGDKWSFARIVSDGFETKSDALNAMIELAIRTKPEPPEPPEPRYIKEGGL
jgi:hypothetical protein